MQQPWAQQHGMPSFPNNACQFAHVTFVNVLPIPVQVLPVSCLLPASNYCFVGHDGSQMMYSGPGTQSLVKESGHQFLQQVPVAFPVSPDMQATGYVQSSSIAAEVPVPANVKDKTGRALLAPDGFGDSKCGSCGKTNAGIQGPQWCKDCLNGRPCKRRVVCKKKKLVTEFGFGCGHARMSMCNRANQTGSNCKFCHCFSAQPDDKKGASRNALKGKGEEELSWLNWWPEFIKSEIIAMVGEYKQKRSVKLLRAPSAPPSRCTGEVKTDGCMENKLEANEESEFQAHKDSELEAYAKMVLQKQMVSPCSKGRLGRFHLFNNGLEPSCYSRSSATVSESKLTGITEAMDSLPRSVSSMSSSSSLSSSS